MPLKLKFEICQSSNCKSLVFKDLTGIYSATNLTGWGAPNPEVIDFNYGKIELFLNGTLIETYASNSVTSPIFNALPTDNILLEYELPSVLIDGVYTIVYTVSEAAEPFPGVIYTKTIQQSFYCNVKCCVMSMVKDIDLECSCSDDIITKFNKGYALLKGLIYNSGCGNPTYFNNILTQLQKLCKNETCLTCK